MSELEEPLEILWSNSPSSFYTWGNWVAERPSHVPQELAAGQSWSEVASWPVGKIPQVEPQVSKKEGNGSPELK